MQGKLERRKTSNKRKGFYWSLTPETKNHKTGNICMMDWPFPNVIFYGMEIGTLDSWLGIFLFVMLFNLLHKNNSHDYTDKELATFYTYVILLGIILYFVTAICSCQ